MKWDVYDSGSFVKMLEQVQHDTLVITHNFEEVSLNLFQGLW